MAYAFADYAQGVLYRDASWNGYVAVGVILTLTLLNIGGARIGKTTQNLLTAAKVIGVSAVIVAGLSASGPPSEMIPSQPVTGPGFGLAMVFVLYAFGGWNDAAFVAAEVRNPPRNLPRALLIGTAGVTVIYLLINMAYLWALGFDGVRKSSTPAADVLYQAIGDGGANAMRVIVMVSALGAVNGLIFTGSRVNASLGADHRLFAVLGRWHPRYRVPIWSLLIQSAVAIALTVAAGTSAGRQTIDRLLAASGLFSGLPWDQYDGGFNTLVAGTAPVFWAFFLLTGISLIVLRFRDPTRPRPFRVPGYPATPIVFCLMCAYMLYSSLAYARVLSLLGLVPLVIGLALYRLSQRSAPPSEPQTPHQHPQD